MIKDYLYAFSSVFLSCSMFVYTRINGDKEFSILFWIVCLISILSVYLMGVAKMNIKNLSEELNK